MYIPLLGLVPALEKGNRDKDDNGLASVADLDLRILVSACCSCPVPTASSIVRCGWVFATASRLEGASLKGGCSYLARRDKLQRAQRALQVGDIVLEVSQRLRNVSPIINMRDWSSDLRWRCWSRSRKGSASRGCWGRSSSTSRTCWRLMSSWSCLSKKFTCSG